MKPLPFPTYSTASATQTTNIEEEQVQHTVLAIEGEGGEGGEGGERKEEKKEEKERIGRNMQ